MQTKTMKLGLGGSCHWCTEAIFLSLNGVLRVEQGWLSSFEEQDWLSEGIIVHFVSELISLKDLVEIHLYTHSSTSKHSMRDKYRSAVYGFSDEQTKQAEDVIQGLQLEFENKIVTKAYLLNSFEESRDKIQNYYYKNPQKLFCRNIINPKLKLLLKKYKHKVNLQKIPEEVISTALT